MYMFRFGGRVEQYHEDQGFDWTNVQKGKYLRGKSKRSRATAAVRL